MQRTHSSGQMSVRASVWPRLRHRLGPLTFKRQDLLEAELPAVWGQLANSRGGRGVVHPEGGARLRG